MVLNKFYLVFLFLVLTGWQSIALSHSVELDAHQHDHYCPLCLAADQNDHFSIIKVVNLTVVIHPTSCRFDVGTSFTPAFQANFFGRAPPQTPFA